MKRNSFTNLLHFLAELEKHGIHYTLAHHRDEALMVCAAVPGERWEVEFFADGSKEVERFVSDGDIGDENDLSELLARFTDPQIAH